MYMHVHHFMHVDPDEMVSFASNLLCLGLEEGLLSLVSDAETQARETIHQAEEELEGWLQGLILYTFLYVDMYNVYAVLFLFNTQ